MIHRTKGMFDIRNIYSGLKSLIMRHRIISRFLIQVITMILCMETYNVIGGSIFQGQYLLALLGFLVVCPTYIMVCEVIDHKLFGRTLERGTWFKVLFSNMFGVGILGIILLNPSNEVLVRLLLHAITNVSIAIYIVRRGKHKVR